MDVLGTVRDVVGKPVPYETAEPRRGDPAILIAGGDLIRSRFAWVPQFSGLSEIVQSAAAWHSSRLAQVFTPL